MSCTSCQALQEQWDIAAANLARASEEARDQGSFRSLAPYPWTYPVYEPTGKQKRPTRRKRSSSLGTRRAVFTQVMRQSEPEARIALRDTCKQLKDIYEEVHYSELELNKLAFNARNPREILVLDYRCQRLRPPPPPPLSFDDVEALNNFATSSQHRPAPTFKAVPQLRPAKRYERDKRIIDSVFFETIVFEEFKRPVYVDELDWTSRTTFHSGVETPAGHVLLETSLASEPLYLAPGHEHASVMCERWTRLANRDWIEYLDSDAALQDAGNLAASGGGGASSTNTSPKSLASDLYEEVEFGSSGEEETDEGLEDSEEDECCCDDGCHHDEETEEGEGSATDSAQSDSSAAPSTRASDDTSVSTGPRPDKASKHGAGAGPIAAQTEPGPDPTSTAEASPLPPFKGKTREGQKRRWQLGRAPVDLIAGFSVEAVAQIVVGRYKPHPDEGCPTKVGPLSLRPDFDRHWARGMRRVSKAWHADGPLYLFMVERSAGWMPVNANDPIIFNNMAPLMQCFTLDHMEAVAAYLNLPPLPPPAKKGRQSASIQDFLWRTFLGTNDEETSSLPSTIKEAICGMIMESWRRTICNECVSLDSPFCPYCTTLVQTGDGRRFKGTKTDLAQSLIVFRRECAKLRRATAPLRLYSSKAPTCTCTTCKKALAKTQAAVNKWSGSE